MAIKKDGKTITIEEDGKKFTIKDIRNLSPEETMQVAKHIDDLYAEFDMAKSELACFKDDLKIRKAWAGESFSAMCSKINGITNGGGPAMVLIATGALFACTAVELTTKIQILPLNEVEQALAMFSSILAWSLSDAVKTVGEGHDSRKEYLADRIRYVGDKEKLKEAIRVLKERIKEIKGELRVLDPKGSMAHKPNDEKVNDEKVNDGKVKETNEPIELTME